MVERILTDLLEEIGQLPDALATAIRLPRHRVAHTALTPRT